MIDKKQSARAVVHGGVYAWSWKPQYAFQLTNLIRNAGLSTIFHMTEV